LPRFGERVMVPAGQETPEWWAGIPTTMSSSMGGGLAGAYQEPIAGSMGLGGVAASPSAQAMQLSYEPWSLPRYTSPTGPTYLSEPGVRAFTPGIGPLGWGEPIGSVAANPGGMGSIYGPQLALDPLSATWIPPANSLGAGTGVAAGGIGASAVPTGGSFLGTDIGASLLSGTQFAPGAALTPAGGAITTGMGATIPAGGALGAAAPIELGFGAVGGSAAPVGAISPGAAGILEGTAAASTMAPWLAPLIIGGGALLGILLGSLFEPDRPKPKYREEIAPPRPTTFRGHRGRRLGRKYGSDLPAGYNV
jgi:hypothetical protein